MPLPHATATATRHCHTPLPLPHATATRHCHAPAIARGAADDVAATPLDGASSPPSASSDSVSVSSASAPPPKLSRSPMSARLSATKAMPTGRPPIARWDSRVPRMLGDIRLLSICRMRSSSVMGGGSSLTGGGAAVSAAAASPAAASPPLGAAWLPPPRPSFPSVLFSPPPLSVTLTIVADTLAATCGRASVVGHRCKDIAVHTHGAVAASIPVEVSSVPFSDHSDQPLDAAGGNESTLARTCPLCNIHSAVRRHPDHLRTCWQRWHRHRSQAREEGRLCALCTSCPSPAAAAGTPCAPAWPASLIAARWRGTGIGRPHHRSFSDAGSLAGTCTCQQLGVPGVTISSPALR
jgi:hypothetical protein